MTPKVTCARASSSTLQIRNSSSGDEHVPREVVELGDCGGQEATAGKGRTVDVRVRCRHRQLTKEWGKTAAGHKKVILEPKGNNKGCGMPLVGDSS